ncbi:Fc receptor-like protein 5 [Cetorhinus maximus]
MMVNYYDKAFCIYKDNQVLSRSPISKQGERVMFSIPAFNHGGRYQCGYCSGISQFFSPMSKAVMVTVAEPLRKPLITLDQSTGVYVVGETVTMTCAVTGDDRQKTFNFYKDDALQSSRQIDTNVNTGTFPVAGRSSKGRYQCQYGISIGGRHLTSPKSEAVTVTTRGPLKTPVIALDQTTGVYAAGETITLTCTVTGDNRKKMFYFYKGHQQLSSRRTITNTNSLRFPNTSPSNSGQYQCQYRITVQSRQFDSKLSQAVTVTIAEPLRKPVITLDLSTGVYVIGETVTMTCTVTGDDREKTFYFHKDGARLYPRQIDTRDNTRKFPITGKGGEGRYECQYGISIGGRDSTSPKSEAVTVTTTDQLRKPRITLNQRTGVYVIGETVTITCTVIGDIRKKTFYFTKDEELRNSWQNVTKGNVGTFQVTGRSSDGPYRCQYGISFEGRHLTSTKSEAVTVTTTEPLKIPVISLDQATGVYAVGETITMTCTVTGDDRQKRFYFYKEYRQLPSSPYITNANSLTFANTSPSHSGQYQCKYSIAIQSRQFDSKQSQAVAVTIAEPLKIPVISLDQTTGVYPLGEPITMTCTVTGDNLAL